MDKTFTVELNEKQLFMLDNLADCLFDMYKCMEHARFLSLPKERQEKMAWSVMADEPRRYGDQPLIKVKEKEEEQ